MNKDELIAKLKRFEWNDVEFKKAQRGVSEDAYLTVSAFSNTSGGYLVFGVKDNHGLYDIIGVIEVDKVQNDLLSCLRSGDKLNHIILVEEDIIDEEGKTLLVFYVPEAKRNEKPVYLNGDIRRSYIRRGGCDEKCTPIEIERFLRDASGLSYDSERIMDFDVEEFYDKESVAWYRRLLQQNQGDRHIDLTEVEFLNEWGFIIEVGEKLYPTRAAVLLFGKAAYVRQILPRGVVDFQRLDSKMADWSHLMRWNDRIVVEDNIIKAWQLLVEKYMRLSERPFAIDTTTLRRHDDPPDYISFREAAINLLIHQDYGDHNSLPTIRMFFDKTIFWNPGAALAPLDQLLEPTAKEVRNPSIVNAFRRIGLSDQAGTGMRSIFTNWRQLGYIPPTIVSDKAENTFEIVLLKEILLTEQQRLFQAQLGVNLSEDEAAVFAYACKNISFTLADAKSTTGKGNRETMLILQHLVIQQVLKADENNMRWELADHLKIRLPNSDQANDQHNTNMKDIVSDQPANIPDKLVIPLVTELTDYQKQIIMLCEIPRKQTELMNELGLSHRTFFRRKNLVPLILYNLIKMTYPKEPNHPEQAYVVTPKGLEFLSIWRSKA